MGAKYVFNPLTGNLDTTDVVAFNGEVNLGTAAAPSVFFTGDTNTGIYSPGADQVAISTNGTGRLFVDASGNVGVGTSSPTNYANFVTFALADTSGAEIDFIKGSTVQGAVYNASDTFYIESKSTVPTAFVTNGSERLRITSDGKLGLGTSAPWTNIEVRGSNVADGVASRTFGTPPSNLHIGVSGYAQNTGGSISFGSDPDSTANYCAYGSIAARRDSALSYEYSGHLTFSTSNGTNLNEQMRLTSAGRLGIGTTAPDSLLDLEFANSRMRFEQESGSNRPLIRGTRTSDKANRSISIGGSDISFLIGSTGTAALTSANEKARIDSDGRLLVGTSSQSGGSLLQVNDDRIRIASSKTPASASDTGTAGEICWDSSYIYVCTATDTWKRAALSTW